MTVFEGLLKSLANGCCLNLRQLIHVKRAAGRPKDLEAIAELEALRDETDSIHDRERIRNHD